MHKLVKKDFSSLKGVLTVPSDKSLSHRAVIFSTLAKGKSVIRNFSFAKDPCSSLEVCKLLGADIEIKGQNLIVSSSGNITAAKSSLNCGNSGTTMRLMAGVLSGQKHNYTLIGDESLSSRPMKRVIEPLSLMGANITSNNFRAPLNINGAQLHGIKYDSPISSAQVKSCILLAGLYAEGETIITEPNLSRNHTEIMLAAMGANIFTEGNSVKIKKSNLSPLEIDICGDISSAAYFLVAGLIVPDADIVLKNVNLNPTRTGIIDVINMMGGQIEILNQKEMCSELCGDIKVKYTDNLKCCSISSSLIPRLIDEIPVISLLATQCDGRTVISDAGDLRNKESDRIKTTVSELKKLGADINELPDGIIINGKTSLWGDVEVKSYMDHRLAMTLYVAGLITNKSISIKDFDWVNISFPEFENLFELLKK